MSEFDCENPGQIFNLANLFKENCNSLFAEINCPFILKRMPLIIIFYKKKKEMKEKKKKEMKKLIG